MILNLVHAILCPPTAPAPCPTKLRQLPLRLREDLREKYIFPWSSAILGFPVVLEFFFFFLFPPPMPVLQFPQTNFPPFFWWMNPPFFRGLKVHRSGNFRWLYRAERPPLGQCYQVLGRPRRFHRAYLVFMADGCVPPWGITFSLPSDPRTWMRLFGDVVHRRQTPAHLPARSFLFFAVPFMQSSPRQPPERDAVRLKRVEISPLLANQSLLFRVTDPWSAW